MSSPTQNLYQGQQGRSWNPLSWRSTSTAPPDEGRPPPVLPTSFCYTPENPETRCPAPAMFQEPPLLPLPSQPPRSRGTFGLRGRSNCPLTTPPRPYPGQPPSGSQGYFPPPQLGVSYQQRTDLTPGYSYPMLPSLPAPTPYGPRPLVPSLPMTPLTKTVNPEIVTPSPSSLPPTETIPMSPEISPSSSETTTPTARTPSLTPSPLPQEPQTMSSMQTGTTMSGPPSHQLTYNSSVPIEQRPGNYEDKTWSTEPQSLNPVQGEPWIDTLPRHKATPSYLPALRPTSMQGSSPIDTESYTLLQLEGYWNDYDHGQRDNRRYSPISYGLWPDERETAPTWTAPYDEGFDTFNYDYGTFGGMDNVIPWTPRVDNVPHPTIFPDSPPRNIFG
ncbi:hypothetical protein EV421DRAFT_1908475 [Armillaria borealis]|uniref:Uncharacterized protein n=1 Tax=Armillaria borealis TaxID=47425 RepID=A0AA39MIP4_9AGAR|nr:hypothetical protein EV421DRAFT_1908475 [Armillaria borealis]